MLPPRLRSLLTLPATFLATALLVLAALPAAALPTDGGAAEKARLALVEARATAGARIALADAARPRPASVATPVPDHLDYAGIVRQIGTWNREAPDLTEVGTYGTSRSGTDLYYLRIGRGGPAVLLTACIHGDEPHATANLMACVGTLLAEYGRVPEVTALLDERTVYMVPVVSPDSYPDRREVDGGDPNRDFPGPRRPAHRSTPSVAALQGLFQKVRPVAVISGHTHGRLYLTPYGDTTQRCPHDADYQRIVGKMAQLSRYTFDRACNMYGTPVAGSELDWYYRNGAFAVVMEVGTHHRPPTRAEVREEFRRTYAAVRYFVDQAPLVQVAAP